MKITDLQLTIEHVRGSYKEFAAGYPLPGVTFPTHYGFIQGYASEDGHDLDVFLGSGELHGYISVYRPTFPNEEETKMIMYVSQAEWDAIHHAYEPVVRGMGTLTEEAFLNRIQPYQKPQEELIYINVLSKNHIQLIDFYTNTVGLTPLEPHTKPEEEHWYGYHTGHTQLAIEPMSNRDSYKFDYQKGNPVLIQFKVHSLNELEQWTQRLEARGVTIGQRVLEKSYGTVTTFADPDGNLIELLYRDW